MLGLDLIMFVDMVTALRELPDVGCVRDLQLLMPSYRATRVLWELVLETLPMSVLQLHVRPLSLLRPLSLSSAAPIPSSAARAAPLPPSLAADLLPPSLPPSPQIYATLKWYELYAPDERPALQSGLAPLLAGSLALSLINLVKCSLLLRWEAQAVGVGVLAHLGQQLQLGRGLPLHALRAHRIDAWQCTVRI